MTSQQQCNISLYKHAVTHNIVHCIVLNIHTTATTEQL